MKWKKDKIPKEYLAALKAELDKEAEAIIVIAVEMTGKKRSELLSVDILNAIKHKEEQERG